METKFHQIFWKLHGINLLDKEESKMDDNSQHNVAAAVASGPKQITELRTWKSIRLDHYKEFCDILRLKYNNNEEEINKNHDYEFDRVITLGLEEWAKEETGYEIIHNGKPADKRVLQKLGRIAYELLLINTYPKVDANALTAILNKALGVTDKRTTRQYRKTILDYCNFDEQIIERCSDSRLGELDVSRFVRRVPREYMKGVAR